MNTDPTTYKPRPETLVALDWDGVVPDIQPLLDMAGEHLLAHVVTTTAHWQTGRPVLTHRVTFDARQVRNTHMSGAAFHAGWLSHVESGY